MTSSVAVFSTNLNQNNSANNGVSMASNNNVNQNVLNQPNGNGSSVPHVKSGKIILSEKLSGPALNVSSGSAHFDAMRKDLSTTNGHNENNSTRVISSAPISTRHIMPSPKIKQLNLLNSNSSANFYSSSPTRQQQRPPSSNEGFHTNSKLSLNQYNDKISYDANGAPRIQSNGNEPFRNGTSRDESAGNNASKHPNTFNESLDFHNSSLSSVSPVSTSLSSSPTSSLLSSPKSLNPNASSNSTGEQNTHQQNGANPTAPNASASPNSLKAVYVSTHHVTLTNGSSNTNAKSSDSLISNKTGSKPNIVTIERSGVQSPSSPRLQEQILSSRSKQQISTPDMPMVRIKYNYKNMPSPKLSTSHFQRSAQTPTNQHPQPLFNSSSVSLNNQSNDAKSSNGHSNDDGAEMSSQPSSMSNSPTPVSLSPPPGNKIPSPPPQSNISAMSMSQHSQSETRPSSALNHINKPNGTLTVNGTTTPIRQIALASLEQDKKPEEHTSTNDSKNTSKMENGNEKLIKEHKRLVQLNNKFNITSITDPRILNLVEENGSMQPNSRSSSSSSNSSDENIKTRIESDFRIKSPKVVPRATLTRSGGLSRAHLSSNNEILNGHTNNINPINSLTKAKKRVSFNDSLLQVYLIPNASNNSANVNNDTSGDESDYNSTKSVNSASKSTTVNHSENGTQTSVSNSYNENSNSNSTHENARSRDSMVNTAATREINSSFISASQNHLTVPVQSKPPGYKNLGNQSTSNFYDLKSKNESGSSYYATPVLVNGHSLDDSAVPIYRQNSILNAKARLNKSHSTNNSVEADRHQPQPQQVMQNTEPSRKINKTQSFNHPRNKFQAPATIEIIGGNNQLPLQRHDRDTSLNGREGYQSLQNSSRQKNMIPIANPVMNGSSANLMNTPRFIRRENGISMRNSSSSPNVFSHQRSASSMPLTHSARTNPAYSSQNQLHDSNPIANVNYNQSGHHLSVHPNLPNRVFSPSVTPDENKQHDAQTNGHSNGGTSPIPIHIENKIPRPTMVPRAATSISHFSKNETPSYRMSHTNFSNAADMKSAARSQGNNEGFNSNGSSNNETGNMSERSCHRSLSINGHNVNGNGGKPDAKAENDLSQQIKYLTNVKRIKPQSMNQFDQNNLKDQSRADFSNFNTAARPPTGNSNHSYNHQNGNGNNPHNHHIHHHHYHNGQQPSNENMHPSNTPQGTPSLIRHSSMSAANRPPSGVKYIFLKPDERQNSNNMENNHQQVSQQQQQQQQFGNQPSSNQSGTINYSYNGFQNGVNNNNANMNGNNKNSSLTIDVSKSGSEFKVYNNNNNLNPNMINHNNNTAMNSKNINSVNQLLALKDSNYMASSNAINALNQGGKLRVPQQPQAPTNNQNLANKFGNSNGVVNEFTPLKLRTNGFHTFNNLAESDFRRTHSALPQLRANSFRANSNGSTAPGNSHSNSYLNIIGTPSYANGFDGSHPNLNQVGSQPHPTASTTNTNGNLAYKLISSPMMSNLKRVKTFLYNQNGNGSTKSGNPNSVTPTPATMERPMSVKSQMADKTSM